jgi:predicted membrane protein
MIVRLCLCVSIIACGLALRAIGFQLGLPAFIVKYGGSLLWGTMVFFLVAMVAQGRSRRTIALIALAIAVAVELFRLVHAPWLDAFRQTTAGALLLGRIFSPWNMLAYAVGISLGVALDRLVTGIARANHSAS